MVSVLLVSVYYWFLCIVCICVLLVSVYCCYLCIAGICEVWVSVYCYYLCIVQLVLLAGHIFLMASSVILETCLLRLRMNF